MLQYVLWLTLLSQCIGKYVDYSDYYPKSIPIQNTFGFQPTNPSSEYREVMQNLCDNWQSPISYLQKRGYMPAISQRGLPNDPNAIDKKSEMLLKGKNYLFFPERDPKQIINKDFPSTRIEGGEEDSKSEPATLDISPEDNKNDTTGIIGKVRDKFLRLFHKGNDSEVANKNVNKNIEKSYEDDDFNEPNMYETYPIRRMYSRSVDENEPHPDDEKTTDEKDEQISDVAFTDLGSHAMVPQASTTTEEDLFKDLSDTDIQFIKTFVNCFKKSRKDFPIQPAAGQAIKTSNTTAKPIDLKEKKPSESKKNETKISDTKGGGAKNITTTIKPICSPTKSDSLLSPTVSTPKTEGGVTSATQATTASPNASTTAGTATTTHKPETGKGLSTPVKGPPDKLTVDLDINQKNGTGEELSRDFTTVSTTVEQPLTTTMEQPLTTDEPSLTTVEQSLTTPVEEPHTTVEPPLTTTVDQSLTTTVEQPLTTTDEQNCLTTVEPTLTTTIEQPLTTTVEPPLTTTVEQPVSTTVEQPVSTTVEQPVSTTVEQPVSTTVENPVSTTVEKPVSTTVEQPLTTTVAQTFSTTVEPPITTTVGQPITTTLKQTVSTTSGQPLTTTVKQPFTTTVTQTFPTTIKPPTTTTVGPTITTTVTQPISTTVGLPLTTTVKQPVPTTVGQSLPTTAQPLTITQCTPTTVAQPLPTTFTQYPSTIVTHSPPTTITQYPPTTVGQSLPTTVAQPLPTTFTQYPSTIVTHSPPTTITQYPPTTVGQSLPTTVVQPLPTTSTQYPPTTVAQYFSTTITQYPPTTVGQSLPTTVAQPLPTTAQYPSTTVAQPLPTTSTQYPSTTVAQYLPTTFTQCPPATVGQSLPPTVPQPQSTTFTQYSPTTVEPLLTNAYNQYLPSTVKDPFTSTIFDNTYTTPGTVCTTPKTIYSTTQYVPTVVTTTVSPLTYPVPITTTTPKYCERPSTTRFRLDSTCSGPMSTPSNVLDDNAKQNIAERARYLAKSKFLAHLHHTVNEVGKPPQKPFDLTRVQDVIDKTKNSTVSMGTSATTECIPLRLNEMSFDLEWNKMKKSLGNDGEKINLVDYPYKANEITPEVNAESMAAKFLKDVNHYSSNNNEYLGTPYGDNFLDSQQFLPDYFQHRSSFGSKREVRHTGSLDNNDNQSQYVPDTEGFDEDEYFGDPFSNTDRQRHLKSRIKTHTKKKTKNKYKSNANKLHSFDDQVAETEAALKNANDFSSFKELKNIQFRVNDDDEEAITKFITNLNTPPEIFSFDVDKYLRSAKYDPKPQLQEVETQAPEQRTFYEFIEAPPIERERLPLIDPPLNLRDETDLRRSNKRNEMKRDLLRQYIKGVSNSLGHLPRSNTDIKKNIDERHNLPDEDGITANFVNNYIEGLDSSIDTTVSTDPPNQDDELLNNFYLLNDGSAPINDLKEKNPDLLPDKRYSSQSLEIDLDLDKKFKDLAISPFNYVNRMRPHTAFMNSDDDNEPANSLNQVVDKTLGPMNSVF